MMGIISNILAKGTIMATDPIVSLIAPSMTNEEQIFIDLMRFAVGPISGGIFIYLLVMYLLALHDQQEGPRKKRNVIIGLIQLVIIVPLILIAPQISKALFG